MIKKTQNKCEAVYGDKRCENLAISMLVSKGQMFSLCKDCYKLEKAQQNNHGKN